MVLPSTYQEVEYIQSSGTQYINTGYNPSNNTRVVSRGFINDSNYAGMYGVYYGGSYMYFCLLKFEGENYQYVSRIRSSSGNSTVYSGVPSGSTVHTFDQSQSGFYIDGTKVGTNGSYSFSENTPIYLFGLYNKRDGIVDAMGTVRIYYLEIYNGNTLVRNLIPCYRISDNVAGLYDLVNDVFYTNSGTGTFIVGPTPAQNGKIKKFLLGTSLIRPEETPSTYEYSYDFRNKSWSTVQSDGWTLAQGTSWTTINSNGINCPTRGQGNSNRVWINRAIDSVGNAKKVTLTMQVYVQAEPWGNLAYYKLAAASTPYDVALAMQIGYSGTTTSGYNGHTGQLGLPNNETLNSPTTIYTGTFLCEGEVDLANKTSKLTVNGTTILTGTVSDSTVSAIRNGSFIHVSGGHDTGTMYIQTIKIKVEY